MKIEKEVVVRLLTTDGQELKEGDEVIFNAIGKCFIGIYRGITKKGSIIFDGVIQEEPVRFNIMPKSITTIEKLKE